MPVPLHTLLLLGPVNGAMVDATCHNSM